MRSKSRIRFPFSWRGTASVWSRSNPMGFHESVCARMFTWSADLSMLKMAASLEHRLVAIERDFSHLQRNPSVTLRKKGKMNIFFYRGGTSRKVYFQSVQFIRKYNSRQFVLEWTSPQNEPSPYSESASFETRIVNAPQKSLASS